MAITFRGSVAAFIANGNDQTTQNIFAFSNGSASRVNVYIRKLIFQVDTTSALATVMPIVKTFRLTTAVSGGILLQECPYDTALTSDANVKIWIPIAFGTPLTATATTPVWEEFGFRLHTAIEKVLAEDSNVLPAIVASTGYEFKLTPGQTLLLQVTGSAATSNPSTSASWWVSALWEEDSLAVFSISGQVTLNATPVAGAKVIVFEADNESLDNLRFIEVKTTDGSGNWSSSIRSGMVGAAFVQYTSGGIYYTAPGNPYLES